MHLETARKAVLAGRLTPVEVSQEIAPTRKSQSADKGGDNKKSKNGNRRRSPDAHQKKAKSLDQRVTRPPSSKYNNFTDLTRSREEVFLATEHTGVYKRPDTMRGDRSKRN